MLANVIVGSTMLVLISTPDIIQSRSRIFSPGRAIDYFRDGDEERLFVWDTTLPTLAEVNRSAGPNDRVLLLIYSRLWLRGDLLAAVSTSAEATEAANLLAKRSQQFWSYLEDKKFRYLVAGSSQFESITAMMEIKPPGFGFCKIKQIDNVVAFQIGEVCLETNRSN